MCVCRTQQSLCGVGFPFAPEQSETKKRADVRGQETDQHHVRPANFTVGPLKFRK